MINLVVGIAVAGSLACVIVWSAVLWLVVAELVAWCQS